MPVLIQSAFACPPHAWRLEEPSNGRHTVAGTCKHCGETRANFLAAEPMPRRYGDKLSSSLSDIHLPGSNAPRGRE